MSVEPARTEARRQLWLVAVVQVLAMSVWFSAAAVVPSLSVAWDISVSSASWLTTSVQLGFVAGAVLAALLNLADRIHLPRLIAASAALAAVTNVLIPVFADGLAVAVPMRFLTGMALAGVYPTGVKLMASWFRQGRGLAMGVLLAALTLGSALPHLVNGFEVLPWRTVVFVTTGTAALAAVIALTLREGPLLGSGARLHPAYVARMFADRRQRLINFGYFGHMWELYAFWTWLPTYLAASFAAWRMDADNHAVVELVAFGVIGVAGAAGCVIGGMLAVRAGSVTVARWALAGSGVCCAVSGVVFGASPVLVIPVLAVWGFSVIADSAQFSAALSNAADPRYVGTALTAQMAIGFVITVGTIRLLPLIASDIGWRWAMSALVLGPVAGLAALRGVDGAGARAGQLNVLTKGEAP